MSDHLKDSYFKSYKSFANTLRTWLIAYGIGGPFLIVSQDALWKSLSSSAASTIALLFLAGLVLQVMHAMLFKWTQWQLYTHERSDAELESNDEADETTGESQPAIAWSLSNAYWIDYVADFGTIIFYALGTLNLIIAIAGAPEAAAVETPASN